MIKRLVNNILVPGLILFLPLLLTITLVGFMVNFLTKPFVGLITPFLLNVSFLEDGIWIFSQEKVIQMISRAIILFGIIFILFFMGLIANHFFIRGCIRIGESILHKIPIVNRVYLSTKEVMHTLFQQDSNSFNQVVLVPFPNKETYSIGLITRDTEPDFELSDRTLVSVFVPASPNPTMGFLMNFKLSEIEPIDMKMEDAMKSIISCGLLLRGLSKHSRN